MLLFTVLHCTKLTTPLFTQKRGSVIFDEKILDKQVGLPLKGAKRNQSKIFVISEWNYHVLSNELLVTILLIRLQLQGAALEIHFNHEAEKTVSFQAQLEIPR